ncbi:S49 family peptidase [Fodinicurvata fenggangensis]|uniref:S49 family peptidase n=1 Tax=Fodinicurvata fenggangensis TaxID=1121830 RepID=UPI00047CD1C4|nr:S49 family peptidase [Fodinicurvata fenggangensis]
MNFLPKDLRKYIPIKAVQNPPPLVGVIRLRGVIGAVGPMRSGMTLESLAPTLEKTFSLKRLQAVALIINSPGGSPVQSALIAQRIRDLSQEKKVPVLAFVEDAAASGGYWLACAADQIYVNESSIVGSIGVASQGFGFTELIQKIGVERRVQTAGSNKNMLDPFEPRKSEDMEHLKGILNELHESFKSEVRRQRVGRLKASEDELFTGAFWTGRRAVELGLVDGIAEARSELRKRFGDKVRLRGFQQQDSWLRRRLKAQAGGLPGTADLAHGLLDAAETRALWARYGL